MELGYDKIQLGTIEDEINLEKYKDSMIAFEPFIIKSIDDIAWKDEDGKIHTVNISDELGDIDKLITTDKTTAVAAINEVKSVSDLNKVDIEQISDTVKLLPPSDMPYGLWVEGGELMEYDENGVKRIMDGVNYLPYPDGQSIYIGPAFTNLRTTTEYSVVVTSDTHRYEIGFDSSVPDVGTYYTTVELVNPNIGTIDSAYHDGGSAIEYNTGSRIEVRTSNRNSLKVNFTSGLPIGTVLRIRLMTSADHIDEFVPMSKTITFPGGNLVVDSIRTSADSTFFFKNQDGNEFHNTINGTQNIGLPTLLSNTYKLYHFFIYNNASMTLSECQAEQKRIEENHYDLKSNTEFKTNPYLLAQNIGLLSNLTTTDKSNLVSAINEIHNSSLVGVSTRRPTNAIGGQYFDIDLGKPIWWNGTDWVDAMGTIIAYVAPIVDDEEGVIVEEVVE